MLINSLILQSQEDKAYQFGYEIGNFIGDNLFLIAGLLIGLIVAIVMRKNLKVKP